MKSNIDAIDISETAINIANKKYPGINFIADDFIKTKKLFGPYDLIIISQILWYVLDSMDIFFEKLNKFAAQNVEVIFIQTYYNPDNQKYGKEIMTRAEDIFKKIPFKVQNLINIKNYRDGDWIDTESIIICKNFR